MPQRHISHPRGSDLVPGSVLLAGRFGRLFRNVPSFDPSEEALKSLAAAMVEPPPQGGGQWEGEPQDLDGVIPAGYTYLGQFIDHDITFDPVSSLQRQDDPEALHNFRTPRFDLDSVYGRGPNNDPHMYDPDIDGGRTTLLLGRNENGEADLPRNVLPPKANGDARGRALIGDPRNDENIIVSQLHLLFLRFHNRVVERVRENQPGLAGDLLFEEAQRVVRWHYQWLVVNDFLRRVVGDAIVDDILRREDDERGTFVIAGEKGDETTEVGLPQVRLAFYRWQRQPFMPVEFSVAAYRFGHSMIRPTYRINDTVPELPIFSANPDPGRFEAFHGFRPLPPGWTVDWSFFFEVESQDNLQVARKIDARLAPPLTTLPGLDPPELAFRNLRRGKVLGLPSGQSVARAMCLVPLTDEALGISELSPEFSGHAPLWFYVLKEAELHGGHRLGAMGGRIVAEVLLGLLSGDPFSFLKVEPCWVPDLGEGSDFTMPDLIRFVT